MKMTAADTHPGIVVLCDTAGNILRVIRDDLAIVPGETPRPALSDVVDADSREKIVQFLREATQAGATFDWEVTVRCQGKLVPLLLIGGLTDIGVIVCGSASHAGLTSLLDNMLKLQNEQINTLRTTLKEDQLEAARHRECERQMLEEFTRVNNELVNTQRELAQRNAQLAEANRRLEALATTDGLTGLKNHREFQDGLAREYAGALRRGHPLSLLLLDVDHFKQFNDGFGHPAGDRVLQRVAHLLAGECRGESLVARYGGEEFAVILPDCTAEDAAVVAERIRQAVELGPWELRPITVSVGVATMLHGMPTRPQLIARADAAMYQAKTTGRNQVCSAGELALGAQALLI